MAYMVSSDESTVVQLNIHASWFHVGIFLDALKKFKPKAPIFQQSLE